MIANTWKKSSRSNGNGGNNCVEVFWKKSTWSNPSGNCVEVRRDPSNDLVWLRDTKLGKNSPVLMFPEQVWIGFTRALKTENALPFGYPINTRPAWDAEGRETGHVEVRDYRLNGGSPILTFTKDEWTAFVEGVKDNEFDLQPA